MPIDSSRPRGDEEKSIIMSEKGRHDKIDSGGAGMLTGVAAAGGLMNAVQMGVGSVVARKSYSLAPCHHLFVSLMFFSMPLTNQSSNKLSIPSVLSV